MASARVIFRWMLGSPSRNVIGTLVVLPDDGGYMVLGSPDITQGDGSLPDVLRCLRFSVIRLLLESRKELIWFHGGAAAERHRAVIFPGERGRGKSTLVTALCAHGWKYLSDDVLPVDPVNGRVLPFPQTPAVRVHPGVEMPPDWLGKAIKTTVELSPRRIARGAQPISAIVFPHYRPGESQTIERLSPAPAALELLETCWNFHTHRTRAVQYVSELLARVPAYRLHYGRGVAAAHLVADVLLPDQISLPA